MSESDGTPVKCLDCGHEWETVAQYPQCSDPNDDCGRSRNVEEISDLEGGTGDASERDPGASGGSQSQSEWEPMFEAQETETEPVEDMSMDEPPELDSGQVASPDPEQGPEPEPEQVEEQVPELEPEDVKFFVKTPFDMASRKRGEHWELNDDELENLSQAYTRVGNKYAPYLLKEHAPEVMAAVTTASVVGPRMMTDKQRKKEQQKAEKDTEPKEESDRQSGQSESQLSDEELRDIETAYDRV